MSSFSDRPILDVMSEAYASMAARGFGAFLAADYLRLLGGDAPKQLPDVLRSFEALEPDAHMGDGGTYRRRAYSRFSCRRGMGGASLTPLAGNSIFQSTEDNAVNGGVLRTFEPLAPEILDGPLLRALIDTDLTHALNCDRSLDGVELAVGVHQVRIVARPDAPGLPTPEGIHRDSELFTFQHFMARSNIEGGEFRAYDEEKQPVFSWQQESPLDTVMFRGTTWHSATPIAAVSPDAIGYRDIFLIDFDRL